MLKYTELILEHFTTQIFMTFLAFVRSREKKTKKIHNMLTNLYIGYMLLYNEDWVTEQSSAFLCKHTAVSVKITIGVRD